MYGILYTSDFMFVDWYRCIVFYIQVILCL